MSGMKNLALALDELREAEVRALMAGGWVSVAVGDKTFWKQSSSGIAALHSQKDAVYKLKGTWETKED